MLKCWKIKLVRDYSIYKYKLFIMEDNWGSQRCKNDVRNLGVTKVSTIPECGGYESYSG